MITKNCSEIFWGSEYLLLVPHLCYKVMQYSKLVLVLLLVLSCMLLHRTKTALLISTHLLKKFRYSFLCSLLMSSTAVLSWRRCDSLYYLAVLSLHRTSFFDTFDSLKPPFALHSKYVLFISLVYISRWLFHLLNKESCLLFLIFIKIFRFSKF